jgi:cytochrome c
MKRSRTGISAGLSALLLLAATPAWAQDLDNGEQIAKRRCGQCHAIGKTGESALKKAPPFREVVKRYPVADLQEALAEGIIVGHKAMPEFTFSPEEIEDLLAYLDSLNDEPG